MNERVRAINDVAKAIKLLASEIKKSQDTSLEYETVFNERLEYLCRPVCAEREAPVIQAWRDRKVEERADFGTYELAQEVDIMLEDRDVVQAMIDEVAFTEHELSLISKDAWAIELQVYLDKAKQELESAKKELGV